MSYRDDVREIQRETWWTMLRAFLVGIVIMLMLYGLGFLATGGDLIIYRFWAPKMANAQREVFEQTQSYVEGKVEYINQLRLAYGNADGPQKEMLRQTILTEAATVNNSKLPVDIQIFVRSLQ